MINIANLKYRVRLILRSGTELDVTDVATGLGYSEGEKELSLKIQCKLGAGEYRGQSLFSLIQPMTPLFIYANPSGEYEEVARGTVAKLKMTETNKEHYLDIETVDEAHALRHSEDDYYFSDDATSSSILEKIFSDHGVPHSISIEDTKHAKKVYRRKNLADMMEDVLSDVREKIGRRYFIRAKSGIVEVIERGTNATIWDFDLDRNLIKVSESFDASKTVTEVKIVGKERKEAKPAVESRVSGLTELGTRTRIYYRDMSKETLGEAEAAARNILKEQGEIKRQVTIDAPDVPTLRKGDRIRISSSNGSGYFFIKKINHNCERVRMTAELEAENGT